MSLPNLPNPFNELPEFDKENVLLFLLATIGQEELGLAHIINAEGEKIQAAVAAFECGDISIDQLLSVNDSVSGVMKRVLQKEILLDFKLDDVAELLKGE
ncbi:hypothetical protein [Bacillus solimangrovi]|uniref:Uncharacterized protein n=1 Tax=Bacillus solimangrovi TaxID=1305675 RepID=A0A1E5LD77_9BACI|nr:hypothetical protein [Bacillus solimangrovi]OEH92022.1 hypothetical protein BFG57_17030 [Bacillus solimangrovi]